MLMLMDSSSLHEACKAVWLNSMRPFCCRHPWPQQGPGQGRSTVIKHIESMPFTLQALLAALAGLKASREGLGCMYSILLTLTALLQAWLNALAGFEAVTEVDFNPREPDRITVNFSNKGADEEQLPPHREELYLQQLHTQGNGDEFMLSRCFRKVGSSAWAALLGL